MCCLSVTVTFSRIRPAGLAVKVSTAECAVNATCSRPVRYGWRTGWPRPLQHCHDLWPLFYMDCGMRCLSNCTPHRSQYAESCSLHWEGRFPLHCLHKAESLSGVDAVLYAAVPLNAVCASYSIQFCHASISLPGRESSLPGRAPGRGSRTNSLVAG
jgi:hypothetical protein